MRYIKILGRRVNYATVCSGSVWPKSKPDMQLIKSIFGKILYNRVRKPRRRGTPITIDFILYMYRHVDSQRKIDKYLLWGRIVLVST